MAEKKETSEKKRRWYQNIADAYRITARTYPWVGWVLAGLGAAIVLVCVLVGVLGSGGAGAIAMWAITGLLLASLADMSILSLLVRRAMYTQIDGTVGSVYAVISQIKRGWIVAEQPIAANKDKDLVWRLIGRPGVVLISEGPTSRVRPLLDQERRRIRRVAQNVPVTVLEVGHGEDQVPLAKVESHLKRLKKVLTKEEVPAVSQRLNAVQSTAAPIPKGIDPMKVRPNRRAMRGR